MYQVGHSVGRRTRTPSMQKWTRMKLEMDSRDPTQLSAEVASNEGYPSPKCSQHQTSCTINAKFIQNPSTQFPDLLFPIWWGFFTQGLEQSDNLYYIMLL